MTNTPKSKVTLQFVVYDNDNQNFKNYILENKIQLNYQSNKAKSSKVKITSPKNGVKVYFGSDFLLKWKLNTNTLVNVLNCMPDKTGCSPIDGGKNLDSGKMGQMHISADIIMSGNSLIKVENALNTSKFDFVEVVALPR